MSRLVSQIQGPKRNYDEGFGTSEMAQTAVEMFTCLSPSYYLLQIFADISLRCFVPFVVCLGISFFMRPWVWCHQQQVEQVFGDPEVHHNKQRMYAVFTMNLVSFATICLFS